MTNLISIIINCHNGEKFLPKCLDSVLEQVYLNWEIIFWDNCSTDDSKKIFFKYKENDNRLHYFYSEKLTNVSVARNFAISKSQGRYICFLDVDDYWEKNKILKQIDFLKKKNASIVFTNFQIEKNINKKKKIFIKKKLDNSNIVDLLLKKYLVGMSTIMFDKTKVEKFLFNKRYHIIGDFDFVMRNSLNENVVGIDEVLVNIVHHESNESHKKFKLYALELLHWYKRHKKDFEKYKNFKKFRGIVYYEIARVCLYEKKIKRFIIFFRKINFILKMKIVMFYFLKIS